MQTTFLYQIILIGWLHPFHVSVCEVEYNQAEQTLEIAQRIFSDDLAEGIKDHFDLETTAGSAQLDSLLPVYLSEHIRITVGGVPMEMDFLGQDTDLGATW